MTDGENRPAPLVITVRDIREQSGGDAVAISVLLAAGTRSEHRTLVIGVSDYAVLKPRKGTVTEEEFEALEAAARLFGAMRCGEKSGARWRSVYGSYGEKDGYGITSMRAVFPARRWRRYPRFFPR